MYYRPSLLDRILLVVKTLSGLLLCLAIFMTGMFLQNTKEVQAYEDLRGFLEDVNAGLYDYRKADIPSEFRIDILEQCLDDSRYVNGRVYVYRFRGYTSADNLLGNVTWEFDGHPGWGDLELWLQVIGFGGMFVCCCWLIARLVFKAPPFVEFLRGFLQD